MLVLVLAWKRKLSKLPSYLNERDAGKRGTETEI